MTTHDLILLSHHRLPVQDASTLGDDEAAAFLNGYTALWHPCVARLGGGPPQIGSPYDHEQPRAGHIYAVPHDPQTTLPDDWEKLVREAGAIAFRATADRQTTLDNLEAALGASAAARNSPATPAPLECARSARSHPALASFFGLGFGLLVLDGLFDAMEHDNLIDRGELWQDVQRAIEALPDAELCWQHLEAAAGKLQGARESLYSVDIHLVDLCWLGEEPKAESGERSAQETLSSVLSAPRFDLGLPLNLVASGEKLEELSKQRPELLAAIQSGLLDGSLEVCGGLYLDREDALLPLESKLWNLLKGLTESEKLLGRRIATFARRHLDTDPGMPLLLRSVGMNRAILVDFDNPQRISHRTTTAVWSAADGSQVDAFTRAPYPADSPQTFFHLTHYLHQTIMQDHTATLALLHDGPVELPWYRDWLELSRLTPVLGKWTTLTGYLNDVQADEYGGGSAADEIHRDHLTDRMPAANGPAMSPAPVSWFARHLRQRRQVDASWTLAALDRSLGGGLDSALWNQLTEMEDQLESNTVILDDLEWARKLDSLQVQVAAALARRLLGRASGTGPGYLLLNPCSYTRRAALELDGFPAPLPVEGAVKACQLEAGTARLVVEVPALGFTWIPRQAQHPAAPAPQPGHPTSARMKLADQHGVRNEFFEADIDPITGGLKAIRDHRSRINRLGQQLVFNPGSTMRVKEVKITSAGPALGEIISEGVLVDAHEQVLATFQQRFRAWSGRPILELRMEVRPHHPPEGHPWHAYYGARFAWRDERALLTRGVNGSSQVASNMQPESPDYLEIHLGNQRTTLFPGGLPFHQRHGGRMLDVILIPQGETAQVFELAIGLDRDYPMQTAQGMASPIVVVPTEKGPPHVGQTGWLFHLDCPGVLLTSLRPAAASNSAIVARLLECSGHGVSAELRCVRDPKKAELVNAWGENAQAATTQGDTVLFDVAQGSLMQLQVEFD